MEQKTKIQIWSKWEGEEPYMYKEYESLNEAAIAMRNFIYGTEHNHEYIVKIINL